MWSGDEEPESVLGGDVGQRCRELLRETAHAHEIIIHARAVNRDHVHMLLSIPPSLSMVRAVQYLKGRSSHKLRSEFGILCKRYWSQHLWSRGYWSLMRPGLCTSKTKRRRSRMRIFKVT
jgi:putative transposase